MQDQYAEVLWQDGEVPVSAQFDDPYFSRHDGLAETRHVFLAGNDLPARFAPGFRIAELGFGTGLNFLTTMRAWIDSGQTGGLEFTSFEAFPMTAQDMARALAVFDTLQDLAAPLVQAWTGTGGTLTFEHGVSLVVVAGDARETLPHWNGQADAWFLDGFSPAKNPELWGADLMAEVGEHTVSGGTVATYTAAGFVRRGLQEGGFDVSRVPGFGRKRHMTRATRL